MKIRHVGLIGTALAAIFLSAWLSADQMSDQAELALKAAIKTETVDGNLKGAIEQYKAIAALSGASRATVATALLRMGQCYEKLGQVEARAAYERLVREFSDQKETVAMAQARLAAMNIASQGSSLVMRRVWEGPDVDHQGGVSWDGLYLSFNHWNPSNIGLRNLATGETRDLTKNTDGKEYPLYPSLISPNGKQVAYTWVDAANAYSVRLVGTNGTGQRVLYSNKELTYIELGAWSRDGASIVSILTRSDKTTRSDTNQIALISVADGSIRVVKTCDSRFPQPRGFSPDDRYIAYDYPPQADAKVRDIFLIAADGSYEVPLVQHPADDQLLGWTPDGTGILFSSDRTGTQGAWIIPVADGKPQGSPELIKPAIGEIDYPMGFTRSGSYFYGVTATTTDAYITTLDTAASRLLTAPARISERFIGANSLPVFSPDGRHLAYFSKRTGAASGDVLCIRSLGTGEEREVAMAPGLLKFGGPRWAAGGQAIQVSGIDMKERQGLYLIDTRTGNVSLLLQSDPETSIWGQGTPDGKSLIICRNFFADKTSRIFLRDLTSGNEREIYRAPSAAYLIDVAISPDGRDLAFTAVQTGVKPLVRWIGVVSVRGGDAREILRLDGGDDIRRDGLEWTPDGQFAVYARSVEASGRTSLELWRVSPRDKTPIKVGMLASNAPSYVPGFSLRIHPDGKSIAFSSGLMKFEVWAMENFLPPAKAAK